MSATRRGSIHEFEKKTLNDEDLVNKEPSSQDERTEQASDAFRSYIRIFGYGMTTDYMFQFVGIACALGSGVAMTMVELVFGNFVTTVTNFSSGEISPAAFREEASRLALYFFCICLVRFVLTYGYSTSLTLAAYRITRNIRHLYVKAGLSQEVAFFDANTGGSLSMQATSNGRLIQAGMSEKLGLVFQGLSTFVSAFTLAFVTQWKLTLITCCIVPAILLVTGIASTLEAAIETQILRVHAQAGSFTESLLSSVRTIQAFDLRNRLVKDLDTFLQKARRLGDKKSPIFGCLFGAEYSIIFAGSGLCFWQGVKMLARGEISDTGDLFIVLMSVVVASSSLTSIAPYLIEFTRAASAASELFQLIDRPSNIDPFDQSGERHVEVEGDVDFDCISFNYPMRPGVTVLKDFTLHIPAGKVTALVGPSGSGKSTIVGLLERWYNPNSGSIKLDGQPINKLNLNWLRKTVRLVQQEPILFSGTVFDNISNGLVGTSWENESHGEKFIRVQEAAKIAFAHDFIENLPRGYDTPIGERGGLLSGGQKQRIAIARSIVSQPRILLLDEATSALDPNAERIVQQALDNVSKGRTTVTIAHKLATIRNADNIVVMDKGCILEQGTHDSLLASQGAYSHLVQAQDLSIAKSDLPSACEDEKPEEACENDNNDILTKHKTLTEADLERRASREDFDRWRTLGLLHTIYRIMVASPELRWIYLLLVVGCLCAAAIYPVQAILMSKFIGVFNYEAARMIDSGSFYALMFLVLGIASLIIYFVVGFTSNMICQAVNHKYRKQIVNDMLRQDLQFFDRAENSTGALTSRADSYPQAILELMGFNIALILIATVGVLSCALLSLAYGWKLGVVIVFAGLPPLVLSGYARIRLEAAIDHKVYKKFSASASVAAEAINAIRTVSSLAIELSVLDRYTKELDHAIAMSTKPILVMMLPFAFTQSVEFAFMALGFWYGCRLISFGDLTTTDFFIAFLAVFFSGQQASILFGFSSSMTKARSAANYIFWLEQLQPTIQETNENRDQFPDHYASMDLENLHFSYPLRPQDLVLRGINFHIQKGQFVAFVGASGCGKSTMIALLERFYDPIKGHIKIDSKLLHAMNPRKYRSKIALVQQEPTLYPISIRENVAMGMPAEDSSSITDSEVEIACRAANAWEFISSLPDGLSTLCGNSGLQLSGGQRQRIAISRALIRKPQVLLLDEATSALDTQSERIVQDALNKVAADGNSITIAVAHRLSTIKHADVICVFEGGKIVESGNHSTLLAKNGVYKMMCEMQGLNV